MGWAGKAGKSYVFLPILVAKCLENRHCFHDFWLEFIFQFCGNPGKARFLKKLFGPNLGNLGPNLPKFKVFYQLFKFESLNLTDFAYFLEGNRIS